MRAYRYQDNVFTFEGCVDVQAEECWCKPWRIDYSHIALYPYVYERAEAASGVRITFSTDSEYIGLILHEVSEGMKLDLFSNGEFVEQYVCSSDNKIMFSQFKKQKKCIEIWLDPRFPFSLEYVLIDASASIEPVHVSKKRWVHYGSSISHSKEGGSPSTIWTGIVAKKLSLHLTNLGFGGNCVMEPMIAKMIRDMKADIITLKLGINCHSGALSKRSFEPNVIGFVSIVREKHPDIPLVVISPIISPEREDRRFFENTLTLKEMREILKAVVDKFKKYGDNNISYVDGLEILGESELEYLPDHLHPNAQGQYVLAENFIRKVFGQL